jgi:hypothetical protein
MNIASSVVTQQNSGLGSMNTGEVLDLFKVSAEGEGQKKKETKGPVSASKILEGWVFFLFDEANRWQLDWTIFLPRMNIATCH